MRWLLAWVLYGVGILIWLIFDQLLPFIGMRGRIYSAYNWAMLASERVQGDGPGPWGEEYL